MMGRRSFLAMTAAGAAWMGAAETARAAGEAPVRECYELRAYEVEITQVTRQRSSAQKSFVIHVTDETLLQKTGGIVQGMSGSPVIQDGLLIGAVTHVFVDDPEQGYGVYIEWMLEQSDALEDKAA